jgi:hypothetical protein
MTPHAVPRGRRSFQPPEKASSALRAGTLFFAASRMPTPLPRNFLTQAASARSSRGTATSG